MAPYSRPAPTPNRARFNSTPNVPLSQATQKLVRLTLDAGEADRRRQGGVALLRQHRLARLAEEAFQQGGLLTLEDLSQLFNCGMRTAPSLATARSFPRFAPPSRIWDGL